MHGDDFDIPDGPAADDELPEDGRRLPLLAVEDAVCFPGTEMEVPLTDPGARRLVRDLMDRPETERRAGVVLTMPGGGRDPFGRREVFPGGTVARVLGLAHGDGGAAGQPPGDAVPRVRLAGEYRFEVTRQIPSATPFRQALARPLGEQALAEEDPAVVELRRRILDLATRILPELSGMVAFDADTLARLHRAEHPFEEVVNRVAAGLDLPAARKLELLLANLAERGRALVSILESRRVVLDRLRPWRHLAANPELN